MQAICEWMKGIMLLFVIGNVLLYLVQGRQYEKYVQFFLQLLMVMAVVAPVANVVINKEEFLDTVAYHSFWQDLDNVARDAQKIEFSNQEYAKTQYEQAVAQSVTELVEQENYTVSQVTVSLSEAYEIEQIWIVLGDKQLAANQEGAERVLIEQIRITQEKPADSYQYAKLRERIKDFYQIEAEQILIEEEKA